jgi:uncharacterized integral membrane protein
MHLVGAFDFTLGATAEWPFILAVILVGLIATAAIVLMVIFFGRRAQGRQRVKERTGDHQRGPR